MSGEGTIYLDHNASTPLAGGVLEAMLPFLREEYANPFSPHEAGRRVADALDRAREEAAALLGGPAGGIAFTSGATESLRIAAEALWRRRRPGADRIVLGPTEHPSAAGAIEVLRERGAMVVRPACDGSGRVGEESLAAALDERTAILVLQAANPETGVLQDFEAADGRRKAAGVPWLCDTTAMAGKLPLPEGPDVVVAAAHKFGGPKGAGMLRVDPARLRTWTAGGRSLRPGTPDVAAWVGAARAATEAARRLRLTGVPDLAGLRDGFERRLAANLEARVVGAEAPRLPNTSMLVLPGVDAALLVEAVSPRLAVGTGSACVGRQPSPTLIALGLGEVAGSAIRISLGPGTSASELDEAAKLLEGAARALRSHRGDS